MFSIIGNLYALAAHLDLLGYQRGSGLGALHHGVSGKVRTVKWRIVNVRSECLSIICRWAEPEKRVS